MTITCETTLQPHHKEAIFRLWNNEYPQRLQFQSPAKVDDYLNGLNDATHYFIAEQHLHGWACVFERQQAVWFALIIDGSLQHQGWGSRLLNTLQENHFELNGWVIDHSNDKKANGEIYTSPLDFYLKHGFQHNASKRLENEQLSAVKVSWRKAY